MSENCNICWRPTSTNRWCGPDMCSAYWAGRHPGADLAMAVCYRIGRELVMAERDALRAERDALKAELASLKAWHPASEPPPVDTMVLVINADDQDDTVGADMFRWSGWVNSYTVTHWREMPPKPEVSNG